MSILLRLNLEVRYVDRGPAGHWLIVDSGQVGYRPEVCRVYPIIGETMKETEARAKALADLIEVGYERRFPHDE